MPLGWMSVRDVSMVKGEVIRHIRNTDNTSLYQVFSEGCPLRIMCAVGYPFSVLFIHWGFQFSVSCLQWGIPSLYCLSIGGFNSL